MATKGVEGFNEILKQYFEGPIREMLAADYSRQAFGGTIKHYKLKYNTCPDHGLEHDWENQQVIAGGSCYNCDGQGLEPPSDETTQWQDCYTCGGKGWQPTRYARQCSRCGYFDLRPGYRD